LLLQAQLEFGNKWSEISKQLKGRSENAVKNRFNMLYKKYKDENKTAHESDVTGALEAVSEGKKEDREWILKTIEEKKKNKSIFLFVNFSIQGEHSKTIEKMTAETGKLTISEIQEEQKMTQAVANAKDNNPASIKVLNEVKLSLIEATTKDVIEHPGQYTCPNFRYVNKSPQRKERLVEESEVFVNPFTRQEVYISEHGIFLCDATGSLVPLTDMSQIKRKDRLSADSCYLLVFFTIYY